MSFGYRPDIYDARDHIFVGASCVAIDLTNHLPPVGDQGQIGSCVSWAFRAAVLTRANVLGLSIPEPSILAPYAMARFLETHSVPLVDDGCRPRDMAKTLRTYGLVRSDRWDYTQDPSDVPPWDVFQHGTDAIVAGYKRIAGTPAERIALIKSAIDAGYPVPFAQVVDQAFMDYTRGSLGKFSGKPLGGHMTCIVAYHGDEFLAMNSWGTSSWGESGMYWAKEERLAEPTCSDFYVVTLKGDSIHES